MFSDLWCRCAVLERGWEEEEEEVKNIFGSGMLTTKYPGAVSGTNSNKSFSKGTVVNSRRLFCNCLFQRNERHLQHEVYNWLSGQREKERTKEKKKSSLFGFSEFSKYFNNKEKL